MHRALYRCRYRQRNDKDTILSFFIIELQQAAVQEQKTFQALTGGVSTREQDLMFTVQQLLEKYENGWQPGVVQEGTGQWFL